VRNVRIIRPADPQDGEAGFDYLAGIAAETVASENLALQLLRIQPGVISAAHSHGEHESAAFVLEGEIVTWFGEEMLKHVTARKGDFVYIPPGVPHVAANYGDVEAIALVARTDPSGQESVKPYPKLDALPHLSKKPGKLPPPRAPRRRI
jgi:uncharacterized RmlC-like cupin family protein